jgi:succinate dehydrogenase / fumarate reductase iron-sulfur subunit
VAACPNASAALFTSAKITHLGVLPQGQPERYERALNMVKQNTIEGFGHCTLMGECEAVCPAHVPLEVIPRMNKDFFKGTLKQRDQKAVVGGG